MWFLVYIVVRPSVGDDDHGISDLSHIGDVFGCG